MADGGRPAGVGPVTYNVDRILDAHTHLTGLESAEQILECMDFCGIEKVFLFAPMLNVQAHEITSDSLDDIRTHNDYCADVCSEAPERLLGFCDDGRLRAGPQGRGRTSRSTSRSGPPPTTSSRSGSGASTPCRPP